jgi:cytochrome P450
MANPLYTAPPLKRSLFSKLCGPTPIEEQRTLKIKKGTVIIVFPAVFHYDDRFWVRPTEFLPDRWDKEPNILHGDTAKLQTRECTMQFPGLISSKRDTFGKAPNRMSMVFSKARSEDSVSLSLRSKLFGREHELQSSESSKDHLFEATHENTSELQAWSFLPFGAGPHTCMGRRLAVRMVESIVCNFLEHDVMFYNGVIPSLFTRKQWHERSASTQAAYNFPADPVLIQLKQPQ